MGIDFTWKGRREEETARWAYSGFNEFRSKLAKEIGVDLRSMEGFSENGKSWEEVNDPLVPLLFHSDCDGELTVEECKIVAPRLREVIAKWPDDYDKQEALTLAKNMDECVMNETPLIFT